jgi:hypothetical protein
MRNFIFLSLFSIFLTGCEKQPLQSKTSAVDSTNRPDQGMEPKTAVGKEQSTQTPEPQTAKAAPKTAKPVAASPTQEELAAEKAARDVGLVPLEFSFAGSDRVIYAPKGATATSTDYDRIMEIKAGDHFELKIYSTYKLMSEILFKRNDLVYEHNEPDRVVSHRPSPLDLKNSVAEPRRHYTIGVVRSNIGYQDFIIISYKYPDDVPEIFTKEDADRMLKAADSFRLKDPLPGDPVEIMQRYAVVYRFKDNSFPEKDKEKFKTESNGVVDPETAVVLEIQEERTTDSTYKVLSQFPELRKLNCTFYSSGSVKSLAEVKKLWDLNATMKDLTDDGIKVIGGLSSLTHLNLRIHKMAGTSLEPLRSLTGLERLFVYGETLGDKDLEMLSSFPNLRYVGLGFRQMTGSGLRHLKGATNLEKVDMSFSQLTDAGFNEMPEYESINRLDLGYTKITSASGPKLAKFTGLEYLILAKTEINDQIIEHLAKLKKLKQLEFRDTKLTLAGRKKLKSLLPADCWMDPDPTK